jgi:uncharacterized membrane protein
LKRKIKKSQFSFLKDELAHFEEQGQLSTEQVKAILESYEVNQRFSLIRILLVVGALFVGAGVLSFIAGNWSYLPKLAKFIILFVGMTGFYLAGWKTEISYPKTSRSLYYIGVFIFGAGIFLIGQMFNLSAESYFAFLAWAVGILPLALYLSDKWIALLAILLLGIYANGLSSPYISDPFILVILIPLLFWLNEQKFDKSRLLFVANTLLTVFFVLMAFIHFEIDERLIPFFLFALGVAMIFLPIERYKGILEWVGALVHGINGILLTIPEYWSLWIDEKQFPYMGILFAIVYLGFVIYLLNRGSLPAILLICSLIFRFYVDLSYDFLPKSLFFVIGGGLLIAFGYWFEKRRKGGRPA